MNPVKNGLVWGSIFRHALALCLAVPFAVKADPGYSWGGVNAYTVNTDGTVDNLEITLTQDATISGNTISFNKFDASSFSRDFWTNLQTLGTPSSNPNDWVDKGQVGFYSDWTIAKVIVQIEADTVTVGGSYTGNKGLGTSVASGVSLTLGSLVISTDPAHTVALTFDASNYQNDANSDQKLALGGRSDDVWTEISHNGNGNNRVYTYAFTGSIEPTTVLELSSDLDDFYGADSLGGSYGTPGLSGLTLHNGKSDPVQTNPLTPTVSGLKVSITYVITPEPGTMALLLTGVPLLLVRRRKSLKKA